MKCLMLGLSLYLSCMMAQNVEAETVFSCQTTDNKQVSLTRDPSTDIFTLLYGADLKKPEVQISKKGSDMGYAIKNSRASNLISTDIYIRSGGTYIVVGVTDYGTSPPEGYFSVEKPPVAFVTSGLCKNGTLVEVLRQRDAEAFKNMTEVDDY